VVEEPHCHSLFVTCLLLLAGGLYGVVIWRRKNRENKRRRSYC